MNRVTRVIPVDPTRPDPAAIEEGAQALRDGKLVAFPTETVYGLGANALDERAVEAIFEAKERPANDPLIVHIAHIGQLNLCAAHVPAAARKLGLAFWAGPLTMILPKRPAIPDVVTAGLGSVAVRVPAHRVARALMEMSGVPVAAPSANRFSRPSPTSAAHVLDDLNGRVDLIFDGGPTEIGLESTIVDFTVDPPALRRPGGLTLEQIRVVIPDVQPVAQRIAADQPQLAPGQLARHYAPRATLTLYEGESGPLVHRLGADIRTATAQGERVGILAPDEDLMALAPVIAAAAAAGRVEVRPYGSRRDPARAARELFGALRDLDATGVSVIFATAVGPAGLGLAIRDRLVRAAEGRVKTC
ncbi:MAG: L-threonylcarbamoyladenylate synthase [Acidobacteriota bacterium]|nr:L-threonylcarbamoyladenylate synthase [Acidobacteriota bacterium]